MDGTIGYVTLFAGNFAPRNWLFCEGQTLSIRDNTPLFSILGTQFGGNGTTNFCLPDLRGKSIIGAGQGPITNYKVGDFGGDITRTLTLDNIPEHGHRLSGSFYPNDSESQNQTSPEGAVYGGQSQFADSADGKMAPWNLQFQSSNTGGNGVIENQNQYIVIQHIICVYGNFPNY